MERMEIHGRCGTAIVYAKVIEEEAIEQIRRMCDYEFTEGVRIRIMPDVHWGKGCTIGTTMTVRDKVVPNLVGVDIGCGMYTVNLGKGEIDLARFDEAAHFVPSGRDVWEGRQEKFDLLALHCYRALKDTKRVARSLGTLGGGNHFIEIDRSADGTNYLVIHTGSRNLGKQVAEYYQNIAIDLSHGKDELFRARDELIRRYKEEGRRSELQGAIMELYRSFEAKAAEIPADLAYLYGSYLEDYLHDIEICQAFARKNREVIARILLERTGLTAGEAFHTIHNYIDTEERILRKRCHRGTRGRACPHPHQYARRQHPRCRTRVGGLELLRTARSGTDHVTQGGEGNALHGRVSQDNGERLYNGRKQEHTRRGPDGV